MQPTEGGRRQQSNNASIDRCPFFRVGQRAACARLRKFCKTARYQGEALALLGLRETEAIRTGVTDEPARDCPTPANLLEQRDRRRSRLQRAAPLRVDVPP